MIRLEMKSNNAMLTEKQQIYQLHSQLNKLINMKFLQVKNHLIIKPSNQSQIKE